LRPGVIGTKGIGSIHRISLARSRVGPNDVQAGWWAGEPHPGGFGPAQPA
jgi:hypothetical protein